MCTKDSKHETTLLTRSEFSLRLLNPALTAAIGLWHFFPFFSFLQKTPNVDGFSVLHPKGRGRIGRQGFFVPGATYSDKMSFSPIQPPVLQGRTGKGNRRNAVDLLPSFSWFNATFIPLTVIRFASEKI